MTLAAGTRVQYNGDGATVSFAISYDTWDVDDTEVILTDSSGVETVWVRGTQYTISLTSPPATSTLTVITTPTDYTPASGETLTILSNLPNTQDTALPLGGSLPSGSVEQMVDQAVRQIQQSEESLNRSLKFPKSDAASLSSDIPSSSNRAGKLLGFDGGGLPVAIVQSDQSATSVTPTDRTTSRTLAVQATLAQGIIDVTDPDYGAVGDGVADDTAAITAADDLNGWKFTPEGDYLTTLAATDLDGPYRGQGQIQDSSGSKRAPYFSAVKSAPSSLGNHDSITTGFDGDWSKGQFAIEHRVTGAATAGQPTSGYLYTPEIYPNYTYLYSESGHNEATGGNDGRTGIAAYKARAYNNGQGDIIAFNGDITIGDTQKAGATHFLAQPAGSIINGQIDTNADYTYLNALEMYLDGKTYDCSGIAGVWNLERNAVSAAQSTYWSGIRVQSVGTVSIDDGFHLRGKVTHGINLAHATLDASGVGLALAQDQRIYWNAAANGSWRTTINDHYVGYDGTKLNFVMGNASILQVYTDRVISAKPHVFPTFTTATQPTVSSFTGAIIYVSDASAGSKFQGSDGSSWVSLG